MAPLDLGAATPALPLYVGGLPRLSIPRTRRQSLKQELATWRVSITAAEQVWFTAEALASAQFAPFVTVDPDQICLDLTELAQTQGLDFGLVEICVRGPLGRDNRFKLGLVPELTVNGHLNLTPPRAGSANPERPILLHTSPALDLTCADPTVRIVAQAPGQFRLISPGQRTQLEVTLQRRVANRVIRVPITLPLPQLAWTLNDGAHIWQQRSLTCPVTWIEQADDPRLMLQLSPALGMIDLPRPQLWLHDPSGQRLQSLTAQGNAIHGWSFRLHDALDTLRASRAAELIATLSLHASTPSPWLPLGFVTCPALQITQRLDLQQLSVQIESDAEAWQLHVAWQQGHPLRDRVIRLWPLWRPWDAPLTQPMPDQADNAYRWTLDRAALPPGRYRLQLAIETAWSSATPMQPGPGADASLDLLLGSGVPSPTSARRALSALLAGATGFDLRAAHRKLVHEDRPEGSDLIQTLAVLSEDETTFTALFAGTWSGSSIFREVAQQRRGLLTLGYLGAYEALHELARERVAALIANWQPSFAALLQALEQSGSITLEALQQQTDTGDDELHLLELLQQLGIVIIDERLAQAETGIRLNDDWLTVLPHGFLQDSLMLYLREIGQFRLLTYAEEQVLARQIAAGLEAEDRLRHEQVDLRMQFELASFMEIDEAKLRQLRRVAQDPVSLATPVGEEADSTLADFIPDPRTLDADEAVTNEMLGAQLQLALGHLDERERRVLELRYGLFDGQTRTLEEIGRAFGVTRERIRQMEVKALKRLKHPRLGKPLKVYLEQI
ncbi:MAG: sigma-70 family RNA polymerase sigma factor [Oscillochloridaceae bacterium umkhey_bin13]